IAGIFAVQFGLSANAARALCYPSAISAGLALDVHRDRFDRGAARHRLFASRNSLQRGGSYSDRVRNEFRDASLSGSRRGSAHPKLGGSVDARYYFRRARIGPPLLSIEQPGAAALELLWRATTGIA